MPEASDGPRIYGAPDSDNRQPTPEQGLRGEQGSAEGRRPELSHTIEASSGKAIEVEEQSGTAFAEATGRARSPEREGSDGAEDGEAVER